MKYNIYEIKMCPVLGKNLLKNLSFSSVLFQEKSNKLTAVKQWIFTAQYLAPLHFSGECNVWHGSLLLA